ncbi:alanine racemase [Nitriliruptor alkaliphilus]|uniref:alanine racemase n=1 Tax=Nitriliruptor alkaliphilus TaxID=427918 RepID=UPI000698042A|nr:alanine racemase [Nitriliruptor alkaliphilus]
MADTGDWTIDWTDKSFPPSAAGIAASRIGEQGWRIGEHFMTPIAALTRSALEHNARRMREYCTQHDVQIAPHGKTTMSPELVSLQLEHGAWGVTVATAWQAQVMIEFGVRRILIANECIDPVGLRMLADQLEERVELEVHAFVDSVGAVEAMVEGLRGRLTRPLPVVVEVGATGHRAGARDPSTAVDVGRAVARSRDLQLAGVGCFEGVFGAERTPSVLRSVQDLLSTTRHVAEELLRADAFRSDGPVLLTAGGSAFFDQVVEVLAGDRTSYERDVEVVIRPGCYITHDHVVYRRSSPLRGHGAQEFRPALHVWARVIATPEPGLAIIDAGKRDVSADGQMPVVEARYRDGEYVPAGVLGQHDPVVDRLNDQHGYVSFRATGDEPLRVGDLVVLGISHPCTTFDKWRTIPVTDDDLHVVSAARTYF